jgi:hypothetical protein
MRNVPSLEPCGKLLLFGVLTALPTIFAIRMLEPGLVLPTLSILLFVQAAIAAIVARAIGARENSATVSFWDFAGAFTLMGCAAAILGEPDQAALLFEEQSVQRPDSRP